MRPEQEQERGYNRPNLHVLQATSPQPSGTFVNGSFRPAQSGGRCLRLRTRAFRTGASPRTARDNPGQLSSIFERRGTADFARVAHTYTRPTALHRLQLQRVKTDRRLRTSRCCRVTTISWDWSQQPLLAFVQGQQVLEVTSHLTPTRPGDAVRTTQGVENSRIP